MKQDSPKSRAVPVLVPMPAERPYPYAVPEGMDVMSGSIVRVPLGPREVAGIVWDGPVETVETKKLRPVSAVFDCPPIDAPTRRFVDWIAAYTLSPPGMVARMLLRAPEAFEPEPWVEGLVYAGASRLPLRFPPWGRQAPAQTRPLIAVSRRDPVRSPGTARCKCRACRARLS